MRAAPFDDLGFARVDTHRASASGVSGGHPRPGQDAGADCRHRRAHRRRAATALLVTRATPEAYDAVRAVVPDARVPRGGAGHRRQPQARSPRGTGTVLVACAGTSDLPVAEEAAVTAEVMGNTVDRLYDVGVAGLHRLLSEHERLRAARVLIVVAGMEGALPSVVAGLVEAPVIAVPTSVGYGASFGGIAALLGMLNSCANGVVGGEHRQRLRRRLRRLRSITVRMARVMLRPRVHRCDAHRVPTRIVSIRGRASPSRRPARERLERAWRPLDRAGARWARRRRATSEGVRFLPIIAGLSAAGAGGARADPRRAAGGGPRARAAAACSASPTTSSRSRPRARVISVHAEPLSGPQAAGRGDRVVRRRDRRRAPQDRAVGRRRRQRQPGAREHPRPAAAAAVEAAHRRSNRSCASATRRSTCRSRSSPTATAATC